MSKPRVFRKRPFFKKYDEMRKSGECVVIYGDKIDYAHRAINRRKLNRYESDLMKDYIIYYGTVRWSC